MNFKRLEENITDVVKEQQIKLGYRKEVIRLYYPLSSLNRILGTDADSSMMLKILDEFSEYMKQRSGEISSTVKDERFCLCLSENISEYIHENTETDGFLYDFISSVSRHDTSVEKITELFKKYSDNVVTEKTENADFDYLIYFKDGIPDNYRYCIKDEGCHLIYHRFTPEDYENL